MAEFVQKRLEELLPELEQLERVQLFSKEEVRAVIKKRKEFEYRLQRKRKSKQDYLKYIEYERNLLQLIWKRRERTGYGHKKADIDHKITDRISQLYRIVCIRFRQDTDLFLAHVQFCRQMKQFAQGSRVFTRLLRAHGHRPDLCVLASNYEMDDNNSPETARRLMLQALKLHPESHQLWVEYFRLELVYVQRLRKRRSLLGVGEAGDDVEDSGKEVGEDEPLLQGAVARVVARRAVEQLQDGDPCRLLVALLAVCGQFDFAAGLEQELMDQMLERFADRALTHDTLARAALQASRVRPRPKLASRLDTCCQRYEHGLTVAPAGELYRYYVSSLLEAARSAVRHRHLVVPRLDAVYRRAEQADALTGAEVAAYSELLTQLGQVQRAAEVLRAGSRQHPRSADLWRRLLQLLMAAGDAAAVRETFEAASVALPDSADGAPAMWAEVMQFACSSDPLYAESVFSAAQTRSAAVSGPLKAPYLRWLADREGLESARQLYSAHHLRPPITRQFFLAMADLEVDLSRLREVYRTACRHLGDTDVDLWLRYLAFEREHGSARDASAVYQLAVKSLKPAESDLFVTQHTLLTTNTEL